MDETAPNNTCHADIKKARWRSVVTADHGRGDASYSRPAAGGVALFSRGDHGQASVDCNIRKLC